MISFVLKPGFGMNTAQAELGFDLEEAGGSQELLPIVAQTEPG